MKMTVTLTVAEGKRLIAKGVAAHPAVKKALKEGIVAIAKGTTNAYVAEEILGEKIPRRDYVLGRTVPKKTKPDPPLTGNCPDVVLENGKRLEGAAVTEIIGRMKAGDVLIKGANAINYERGQAAVLVGHPTGGTLGATMGTAISKKLEIIVPVGLEKHIPGNLNTIAAHIASQDELKGSVPSLWVIPGGIFTELEALETLAQVEAIPVGAGGVAGAEGAIWLLVHGKGQALEKVERIVAEVQGEPLF